MSATWGRKFKITIFGESHGSHIGIVLDGVPSGTKIDMDSIIEEMDRRAPGRNDISTARRESDSPEIISGIFEGRATGAPLTMIIKNKDHRSNDYSQVRDIMRPGHADYSSREKYKGFNDYRGSGHFSGRITAPLVFVGAIAKQILEEKDIYISSHIASVKNIKDEKFSEETLNKEVFKRLKKESLPLLNKSKREIIHRKIIEAKEEGDSLGGTVECSVVGLKAGVGDPFFESIESVISSLMFSIPAVKGIEFGSGFDMSKMLGSQANDEFYYDLDDKVRTRTNHNGGINGGISNGMPIVFTLAIKAPSSISKKQRSINLKTKSNQDFELKGRHDPIIIPRVIPVVEACAAISILDCLLVDGSEIKW
ncbi:MAG: chorismate synthase [Peptostreptococcus sp.]|uniref:chorismate synthase n=1 Tax=Peptostreptococcus sp. TaxID=1262 RepID=UPI002FC6018E